MKADNITHTDVALNYSVRVGGGVELFVKPEVTNIFNEQGVQSFNQEVLTALDCTGSATQNTACPAAGLKAFNPFTETPVEGVNYIKGTGFGKPESESDYQLARTFKVSLGLRF